MANILTNVDITDLVVINVFKGQASKQDPNPLVVTVDPIDNTKKVQFDTSALTVLNNRLNEKVRGANSKDPNTVGWIKEFVTKMISEFYRNGLIEIVDIPDTPDDPYAEAKKLIKRK
jgi:hypothetical protein